MCEERMNRNALIHELQIKGWIRKLRNRKNPAIFLAIVAFVSVLSVAYSLPTSSLVIGNTGSISLSGVTAKSGSPADIQTAVNAIVALGGGTVNIPAGTFTFDPTVSGGVTIPFTKVPINIIGAGIGVTVLRETINPGGSSMFSRIWGGQNYNGSAVRISGISFVGLVVNETVTTNNAIHIVCTQDFRIDHCSFQDFAQAAIYTDDGTGATYKLVNRGVIDHCSFDNPYRDMWAPHNSSTSTWALWGYGIIVVGDVYTWDPTITDLLGNYYPVRTVGGLPEPQPIYIENCNFTRTRHAISSNSAGFYVSRYNYFQAAYGGQNDVHGNQGTPVWGGRGIESYGNVFNFTDESYSYGQDFALLLRGGGGVFWNNTIIVNPNYPTHIVGLSNDGEAAPYDVEQFYAWNNIATWTNGTVFDWTTRLTMVNGYNYTQNVNYFLRAPNQSLDGFTYNPYTYPLPLTQP
jgi:hypothetical protein